MREIAWGIVHYVGLIIIIAGMLTAWMRRSLGIGLGSLFVGGVMAGGVEAVNFLMRLTA